jgi:hypothetical protein
VARKKKAWDPNRKSGRGRQAHFMDVAMDGYVRDVALHCWRDFEALSQTPGQDEARAMAEAGAFPTAGAYRGLWQQAWQAHVWPGPPERTQHPFARMEAAVRQAVEQERQARAERGDVTIEDTQAYQEFVARAMNRLLEEASGEIEEM